MNRYRLVFKTITDALNVDTIEAPSAADAIASMATKHEHFELISIRVESRDPLPLPPATVAVVLESLAKALLRENTVLLALLGNSIFSASLSPTRLKSLQDVTRDAQAALDLAQTIGVVIK